MKRRIIKTSFLANEIFKEWDNKKSLSEIKYFRAIGFYFIQTTDEYGIPSGGISIYNLHCF